MTSPRDAPAGRGDRRVPDTVRECRANEPRRDVPKRYMARMLRWSHHLVALLNRRTVEPYETACSGVHSGTARPSRGGYRLCLCRPSMTTPARRANLAAGTDADRATLETAGFMPRTVVGDRIIIELEKVAVTLKRSTSLVDAFRFARTSPTKTRTPLRVAERRRPAVWCGFVIVRSATFFERTDAARCRDCQLCFTASKRRRF